MILIIANTLLKILKIGLMMQSIAVKQHRKRFKVATRRNIVLKELTLLNTYVV